MADPLGIALRLARRALERDAARHADAAARARDAADAHDRAALAIAAEVAGAESAMQLPQGLAPWLAKASAGKQELLRAAGAADTVKRQTNHRLRGSIGRAKSLETLHDRRALQARRDALRRVQADLDDRGRPAVAP